MKIFKNITLFALGILLLSSCSATLPGIVTNNPVGKKTGVSSTACIFSGVGLRASNYGFIGVNSSYLGIIFNGDFGIVDAAKNGKISKIATVDVKVTQYFLFSKIEYIVTGE